MSRDHFNPIGYGTPMSDIVERLRIMGYMPCMEAADEIERLRGCQEGDAESIKFLAGEIERLRAALGELLSGHDNLYVAYFGPGSNPHDDIAAKPARRALEPKP